MEKWKKGLFIGLKIIAIVLWSLVVVVLVYKVATMSWKSIVISTVLLTAIVGLWLLWLNNAEELPFFAWGEYEGEHDEKDQGKGLKHVRINLFGLVEFRRVPPKTEWWYRKAKGSDPERKIGYHMQPEGWQWIFFPGLINIPVGMVRTYGWTIDLPALEFQSRTARVSLDIAGTIHIHDPLKFLTEFNEDLGELIGRYIREPMMVFTSKYDAVEFIKLKEEQLQELERLMTNYLRYQPLQTSRGGHKYKKLEDFGFRTEIRVEDTGAAKETLDAVTRLETARLEADAIKIRAEGMEAIKDAVKDAPGFLGTAIALIEWFRPILEVSRSGSLGVKIFPDFLGGVSMGANQDVFKGQDKGKKKEGEE